MRRSFSPGDETSINSAPSLILFIAGMAAAMAMITSLCGVRFRRRSEPDEDSKSASLEEGQAAGLDASGSEPDSDKAKENEDCQFKELPLPPGKQPIDSGSACGPAGGIKKSASTRQLNLTKAISTRIPRSLSLVAGRGEKKMNFKTNFKLEESYIPKKKKHEESLWKKTIILGEKCRLPVEDGHDESAVYDDNGRKIPTYHPKTTSFRNVGGNAAPPVFNDKDQKNETEKDEEEVS